MKPRLKTSWETYNRIIWDTKLNERVFVIGYIDRVAKSGIGEKPVIEWSTSDIPWSRVQYFSCGDTIVWDRNKRIDLLESDDLPAMAFNKNNAGTGKIGLPSADFIPKPVYHFQGENWGYFKQPTQNLEISQLKIATYNILSDEYKQDFIPANERFVAIAEHLKACDAAIIVLQEATRNFLKYLFDSAWAKEYFVSDVPMNTHFYTHRVVILSKYSFELEAFDYSDRKQFLVGSWTFNQRPFHLCGVHLSSNMADNAPTIRARQLAILTEHLQALSGDFVIAGDFNMREEENKVFLKEKHLQDVWRSLHPKDLGYTFDTTKNRIAAHFSLSKIPSRYDRILLHHTRKTTWNAENVELFACEPLKGNDTYPSDHFGLSATFSYEEPTSKEVSISTLENIQPTYRSAIVIIPPKAAWKTIQPLRELYDSKVGRWMPHITLIYGFWPEEYFELAAEQIAPIAKRINPFSLELKEYGYFSHRLNTTAWVLPVSDELKPLQASLQALFPNCDEQSKRAQGYSPHLSIGQFDSVIEAKQILPMWSSIDFEVGAIALISRVGEEPFNVQCEVELGTGKIKYLDKAKASRFALRKVLRTLAPSISTTQKELQAFALDCVRQACEEIVGYKVALHLLGSAKLGTASSTSDLDALCLIPAGLSKLDFFENVQRKLDGICAKSTLAMDAHVPILRLEIESVAIDLLCVQQANFPAVIQTIEEEDASRFDEISWQAFSGYLEVERILEQVVLHLPKADFISLVKAVRTWAKARLIKGNAWGFLGNYSWTVLAAWACTRLPEQGKRLGIDELLLHFFKTVSSHNWERLVALTEEGKNCKVRSKQDRMPIITCIAPHFNSARNVTASTAKTIKREIRRGLTISKQSMQNEKLWASLFEKAKRPASEENLLKIRLQAKDEAHLQQLCGWLEGNIVGLIISLEKHLEAEVRPWIGFEEKGLEAIACLSVSFDGEGVGLDGVLKEFSHRFQAENTGEIVCGRATELKNSRGLGH